MILQLVKCQAQYSCRTKLVRPDPALAEPGQACSIQRDRYCGLPGLKFVLTGIFADDLVGDNGQAAVGTAAQRQPDVAPLCHGSAPIASVTAFACSLFIGSPPFIRLESTITSLQSKGNPARSSQCDGSRLLAKPDWLGL